MKASNMVIQWAGSMAMWHMQVQEYGKVGISQHQYVMSSPHIVAIEAIVSSPCIITKEAVMSSPCVIAIEAVAQHSDE